MKSPFPALLLASWASVANAADWTSFSPLPTGGAARTWGAGVRHPDGRIFCIGGSPWIGSAQDGTVHYLTSNSSTWITAQALDGPKISQAAGVDSLARIIVYGGKDQNNGDTFSSRPYDVIEGLSGNMSERDPDLWPVAHFAYATDSSGRLYAIGGNDGDGGPNQAHADRYDASLDVWQTIAPMNIAVGDAAAEFDGLGNILVIGGVNANLTGRTANVAQYNIATDTWSDTALPDLPIPVSGHRVIRGSDNRIYVLGGETGPMGAGSTVSAVWALNLNLPGSTWSAVASMATPRKHFAAWLDSTNTRILVMGGENDTGGTHLCETLFTPTCPTISSQTESVLAWQGAVAGFWVSVSGAGPLTYEWRKNGELLTDGPTGTGSVVSGANSASLSINNPDADDIAQYQATISNACGSVTSSMMTMTLRNPPTPSTQWQVTNLHPASIQNSSVANGIADGRIVGSGNTPIVLPDGRTFHTDRPLLWNSASSNALDITPAGSVGGAIFDVQGNVLTGWFWHTWSCLGGGQYWTCAWRSAGSWDASTLIFTERHVSGAEYDSLYGTDGNQMVGTVTHEYSEGNYTSTAQLFDLHGLWRNLHPAGASHSGANAADGGFQYGHIYTSYPSPTAHAARWSGTSASFVDMHPAGFSSSSISSAADGQAVGSITTLGSSHAGLWSGPSAFTDLHPVPGLSSNAVAVDQGIQVGNVGSNAALWLGTSSSYINLGTFVPTGFTSTYANDVEVGADLTVTIVGAGFNSITGRSEALVWRSLPPCRADFNGDGTVDFFDYLDFVDAFAGNLSAADFNNDSIVDFFDYLDFVDAFSIGC